MLWFNSEVRSLPFSNNKMLRFIDFKALDPNFVLAIELPIPKLEGSSYGMRPLIYVLKGWYDETPKRVAIRVMK